MGLRRTRLPAERAAHLRTLYEQLLVATEAQMAVADTHWESEVLALTERAARRGLAVMRVRAPEVFSEETPESVPSSP